MVEQQRVSDQRGYVSMLQHHVSVTRRESGRDSTDFRPIV